MSEEERIPALVDELHDEAVEIAWAIVGSRTTVEHIKLNETKRMLVDIGIQSGVPSAVRETA